jgi:hypothetical protein
MSLDRSSRMSEPELELKRLRSLHGELGAPFAYWFPGKRVMVERGVLEGSPKKKIPL